MNAVILAINFNALLSCVVGSTICPRGTSSGQEVGAEPSFQSGTKPPRYEKRAEPMPKAVTGPRRTEGALEGQVEKVTHRGREAAPQKFEARIAPKKSPAESGLNKSGTPPTVHQKTTPEKFNNS